MENSRMTRLVKVVHFILLLSLLIWNCLVISADEDADTTTRSPVKLSAILRNISLSLQKPTNVHLISDSIPGASATRVPTRRRVRTRIRSVNRAGNFSSPLRTNPHYANVSKEESESRRESVLEPQPLSKISGIVKAGMESPQELIRNALINHTLEHGGEQDLDKLVFSNLPNGSKLVFRTVKIVRTDEDGNPMDELEHAQPTYFDVTLANVTGLHENDEDYDEESESESNEGSDEEVDARDDGKSNATEFGSQEEATAREIATPIALRSVKPKDGENSTAQRKFRVGGKKKSDLEISGSHSAANYHHLNDYGTVGREKDHGTTRFYGNNHGDLHKQTYTVTDGKDVKPYHGTEKGLTDYANDSGKSNNDKGERFKSSKRKNKGRKVTGFKRVYHKEEYQRTEHFYDDEEAKKIAESFGLSEQKHGNNHGTKDDKRNYQGVRTEYLDGKKHENEHGTHDGYNKGQHTTYKDSEKHSHHSNYGKLNSHGSLPQHNQDGYDDYQQNHHNNHHNHHPQEQHSDYHPNHNYDASYSNPKQNTITHVPQLQTDQLGGTRSVAAVISAPMAHSFSVTEYAPIVAESISSYPQKQSVLNSLPTFDYVNGSFIIPPQAFENKTVINDEATYRPRRPFRKRPRERKIFYSPKHRIVKEEDEKIPVHQNTNEQLDPRATVGPKTPPRVSYHVYSAVPDIPDGNENEKDRGQAAGEVATNYSPYAPNFGPPTLDTQYTAIPQEYNREPESRNPKHTHWYHRRHKKRPRHRPEVYSQHHMQNQKATSYPMTFNQMHLAGIPFRHASAFNRLGLGNRHQRYQTLRHHPKQLHHYEISTRKSDTVYENDNATSLYPGIENDSAHYFNHNHRYAKHHLTSTINPFESSISANTNNIKGVRNTLFDPAPDLYSTMIKVLPTNMLSVNDSAGKQFGPGRDQHHLSSNAIKVSGQSSPVTQRPLMQADTVSITTAYPQHHPPEYHQMPKSRWLTFTLALPNLKLGNLGPSSHKPINHHHRHKKGSYIMQGIKNGILKQFGRGRHSHKASNVHLLPQHNNNIQMYMSPYESAHLGPQIVMHKRPHHPIFPHNIVSYGNFAQQPPAPIAHSLMQGASPSLLAMKTEKPKFYYKPNETANGFVTNDKGKVEVADNRGDASETSRHKPTLKVAKPQTSGPLTPNSSKDEIQTTTQRPEIGFFGKMG